MKVRCMKENLMEFCLAAVNTFASLRFVTICAYDSPLFVCL